MKIFRIYQNVNNDYDTYNEAVVIAETAEEAQAMSPGGSGFGDKYSGLPGKVVQVEYIGEAKEGSVKSVVCASFHAG